MKLRAHLISKTFTIGTVLFAACVSMAATVPTLGTQDPNDVTAKQVTKYQAMLISANAGEADGEKQRQRILSLNRNEISELTNVSNSWMVTSKVLRRRAILTFDVLRKNRSFDKSSAAAVLKRLENSVQKEPEKPAPETSARESTTEKRLTLFLAAKAGQLNTARIEKELVFISDRSRDSVERLGVAGALAETMTDEGMKPSVSQLQTFLKNDVSEIRILAVDWHRQAPAIDPIDRAKFLTVALATNPRQVADRAWRACELDKSKLVREKCSAAKVEADKL